MVDIPSGVAHAVKQAIRDRQSLNFSDAAMAGTDTITLPDPVDDVSDCPRDIENWLARQGYTITNYAAGQCETQYATARGFKARPGRIGRILKDTKAPEGMQRAFQMDHSRQGATIRSRRVMITRCPKLVATMSTGRRWTSCMSMIDPEGNDRFPEQLKYDIIQGTHVAYLIEEGDDECKRPLGRIALKIYTDQEEDIVLRAEPRTYGIDTPMFRRMVESWCETNFPLADNRVYLKSTLTYPDGGPRGVAGKLTDRQLVHTLKGNRYKYLPREWQEEALLKARAERAAAQRAEERDANRAFLAAFDDDPPPPDLARERYELLWRVAPPAPDEVEYDLEAPRIPRVDPRIEAALRRAVGRWVEDVDGVAPDLVDD